MQATHHSIDDSDPTSWTPERIRSNVQAMLNVDNVKGIGVLLYSLEKTSDWFYSPQVNSCIDTLLETDRVDLLPKAVSMLNDYGAKKAQWGGRNFEFMIEHCPRMYQEWENGDYQGSLDLLSQLLMAQSDTKKETILRGHGTSKCEQRFYELLVQDNSLWTWVSPVWAGKTNTGLRRAALDLGLTHNVLLNMFYEQDEPNEQCCAVFAYPYSLFQLACIFKNMKTREVLGPKYDEYHASSYDVTCSTNANPQDVAFANALGYYAAAAIGADISAGRHFALESGATENMSSMELLVKSYLALDGLDLLAEFLIDDALPGLASQATMELPALDGP